MIPEIPIEINEVSFYSENSLIVNSNNNENVKIDTVKVQQKAVGTIQNATIVGKVVFGLLSSLEINENVNLASSTIELSYNEKISQGEDDKAPINGVIKSTPNKITIADRKQSQLLEEQTYIIAESNEKFNCDEWKEKVDKHRILNDFYCSPELGETVNQKTVYRLYGKNKKDDSKGGKPLSAGVIAAIVIVVVVVVGAVIFVLVYFLVIKKKSKNDSTSEEGNDGNEANEV